MWSTVPDEAWVAREVLERWGELLAEIGRDAAERDEAGEAVPDDFLRRAARAGLPSVVLPREVGGEAVDPLTWAMMLEQIGYLCRDTGFPLIIGIRAVIAQALWESGRADLREEYVVPVACGDLGIALAYSEDADAFNLRTRLRQSGDGCRLTGRKDFITGGAVSDVFLTYARTEPGDMAACLVHRDDPGVRVRPLRPAGTRTSGPAALELDDVALPRHRIVAAVDGLSHAQRILNARRLVVCCAPVGRARALVELTIARLNATDRHDGPVSSLPNVQAVLGRMFTAVEAARAMLYHATAHAARGGDDPVFDAIVSAAKLFVVDQVRIVMEHALQVLGGHAYYGDPYFGICLRDFSGLVAVAGTQDLLAVNLGALAATCLAPPPPARDGPDAGRSAPLQPHDCDPRKSNPGKSDPGKPDPRKADPT